jgi:hypothetical protein
MVLRLDPTAIVGHSEALLPVSLLSRDTNARRRLWDDILIPLPIRFWKSWTKRASSPRTEGRSPLVTIADGGTGGTAFGISFTELKRSDTIAAWKTLSLKFRCANALPPQFHLDDIPWFRRSKTVQRNIRELRIGIIFAGYPNGRISWTSRLNSHERVSEQRVSTFSVFLRRVKWVY